MHACTMLYYTINFINQYIILIVIGAKGNNGETVTNKSDVDALYSAFPFILPLHH